MRLFIIGYFIITASSFIFASSNMLHFHNKLGTIEQAEKDINDFLEAILNGDITLCRSFLNKGLNPNLQATTNGNAPLHFAVNSNVEMVEFLLDHGADPNITNYSGSTPLLLAVGLNQKKIAQSLIAAGANANIKNKHGVTPLMALVFIEERRIVNYNVNDHKLGSDSLLASHWPAWTKTWDKIFDHTHFLYRNNTNN